MADDVSQETLDPAPVGAAHEDDPMVARLDAYIADARSKMEAALKAQPFRDTPSFADLLVMGEAMLRHLLGAHPHDPAYDPPAPQPSEPETPAGATGAAS